MTHSLRTAALATACALLAAAAAEACHMHSPYSAGYYGGYSAGYYPGYSAAYAPSYLGGSYYSPVSYGSAYGFGYGASYGSACCAPAMSYFAPSCGSCCDPCGGCGMSCGSCDPCGGCGMGGCGAGGCGPGGCGVGGCEPALPAPGGLPTPAGEPVPSDSAAPGGGAPPRNPTFIEEPLPQDTQPRDDGGFAPLRENGSDYDGSRQPPTDVPGTQPDGFAPKQPTFDEQPGGEAPFGGGTFGSDTRLRMPSFGPWRPENGTEPPGEVPTPRDGKADSIRGHRPAPALNLDDKIARRPTPQRTRLTDRGPQTTSNAGWMPTDAPAQLVRK
jgi:hypothetical protein